MNASIGQVTTAAGQPTSDPARTPGPGWHAAHQGTWWMQCREASLNWLALGVLLAAWNTADKEAVQSPRRPAALRGYTTVSVRATTLHPEQRRSHAVIRVAPMA